MKENENVYFNARKKASMYNEKLKSREGAAELLAISPSTLADYELGITKVVPVDKVVLMADLYNAPDLLTRYCLKECPIHGFLPLATKNEDIRDTTLKLLNHTNLSELDDIRNELIEIVSDGMISEAEREKLNRIIQKLEAIAKETSALKITYQKMIHE